MSKKVLRSIYLDIEQVERLKKLSAQTRVPQAVYIRDAIDLVLNMHAKKTRKKVSIMTIKYMEKCGEVCQRKLGAIWVALIGIVAVVAILSALIGW